ncbi:MAG: hypothetical protein P4L98_04300 [Ancalomicrobiaceae bacterium]|nr:hypothetical protein [Ancalomicrobiaceae bacterium]
MAMILAIALVVAPAYAVAGVAPCHDGPQATGHGEPTSLQAHTLRYDQAHLVTAARADIGAQPTHHDRNCCQSGCLACSPFLAQTRDLAADVGLALRFSRSADDHGEGLAPPPLVGPPRFQA